VGVFSLVEGGFGVEPCFAIPNGKPTRIFVFLFCRYSKKWGRLLILLAFIPKTTVLYKISRIII
jgi:hypothetical protein